MFKSVAWETSKSTYLWYGVNLIKYDMMDRFIYMDVMQTIGDIRAGLVSLTLEQVHFNEQLLLVVMSGNVLPVLLLSNILYQSHAIMHKPGMCDGHSSSSNIHLGPHHWRVHFLLCLIAYLSVITLPNVSRCLFVLCTIWDFFMLWKTFKFWTFKLVVCTSILIWEV